jgi:hypothetical protein
VENKTVGKRYLAKIGHFSRYIGVLAPRITKKLSFIKFPPLFRENVTEGFMRTNVYFPEQNLALADSTGLSNKSLIFCFLALINVSNDQK